MAKNKSEMMLVDEVAKAAGVSGFSVRNLLRKGILAGEKRGGIWVISAEEARRYVESRKGRERAFFGRKKRKADQ